MEILRETLNTPEKGTIQKNTNTLDHRAGPLRRTSDRTTAVEWLTLTWITIIGLFRSIYLGALFPHRKRDPNLICKFSPCMWRFPPRTPVSPTTNHITTELHCVSEVWPFSVTVSWPVHNVMYFILRKHIISEMTWLISCFCFIKNMIHILYLFQICWVIGKHNALRFTISISTDMTEHMMLESLKSRLIIYWKVIVFSEIKKVFLHRLSLCADTSKHY